VLAERFWNGAGHVDPLGAMVGAQVVRAAGDTGAARLRWADRYAAANSGTAEYAYRNFASGPGLWRATIARLTPLVERLQRPDDSRRPLELTRAEAAVADSARARAALGLLAEAQLAAGDTGAARDALVRATDGGWDARLFRRAATAQLALRDTARAVALLARLVADPGTPRGDADSLAAMARRATDAARWQAMVAEARQAMREYFLAHAARDPLPADIPLVERDGRTTSLDRVTDGRVAVVAFWSRNCGPSHQQMRLLDSLDARLARRGMTLVAITDEAPSPEVAAFLREQGVHVPTFHDRTGAARRAFVQWAVPDYYVVDGEGRVRFRHSALDLVLAQAVAVAEERGAEAPTGRPQPREGSR
jgi:thiol-disulfide isomerase/thioredoxin